MREKVFGRGLISYITGMKVGFCCGFIYVFLFMCLVFVAWQVHPVYDLIVLSNRDERYDRPTLLAHRWLDKALVAGRDEEKQGTWCGVNPLGSMAVVTNYRDPTQVVPVGAYSRGLLPVAFLEQGASTPTAMEDFLIQCRNTAAHYANYSLLIANRTCLGYINSQCSKTELLPPGIYGLSNAYLNSPWPKVQQGLASFQHLLQTPTLDTDACWAMMEDTTVAADFVLPKTGISYEKEKAYSAAFIITPNYGTRTTTMLLRNQKKMVFIEKTHLPLPVQITRHDLLLNGS